MRRLIQLIPFHHSYDAAGSEALLIERLLGKAGWQVTTYADEMDDELRGSTRPFSELGPGDVEGAIALYHYCAASEMTWRFAELDCPTAMIYHNVTPHTFFEQWDPNIAIDCREGRRQLKAITDYVDLAIAHSEFSRRELDEVGFDATRTIPFLFDQDRLEVRPDPEMLRRLEGSTNVLFVGRCAPNKAPDDFIRVAKAYKERDYPDARFVLVGKRDVIPSYAGKIDALIAWSGLDEDRLLLTDTVSQEELIACYRSADLFLSLSQHEGFMVPLIESMFFDIPVLALARAAVPETLSDAGLLFDTTDPDKVAEMVNLMLTDEDLRTELIKRGRNRLLHFDLGHWTFVLRILLEQL